MGIGVSILEIKFNLHDSQKQRLYFYLCFKFISKTNKVVSLGTPCIPLNIINIMYRY